MQFPGISGFQNITPLKSSALGSLVYFNGSPFCNSLEYQVFKRCNALVIRLGGIKFIMVSTMYWSKSNSGPLYWNTNFNKNTCFDIHIHIAFYCVVGFGTWALSRKTPIICRFNLKMTLINGTRNRKGRVYYLLSRVKCQFYCQLIERKGCTCDKS